MLALSTFLPYLLTFALFASYGEYYFSTPCNMSEVLFTPPTWADDSHPCFIVGNEPLPHEMEPIIISLVSGSVLTCDPLHSTIGNVPDVSTATRSFSNINFAKSSKTPLRFALENFATKTPVSSNSLRVFQEWLDMYLATEIGIRSEGGSLEIVVVRKFLEFQVARIKQAKGIETSDPTQTVEVLIEELARNMNKSDDILLSDIMLLVAGMDSPRRDLT